MFLFNFNSKIRRHQGETKPRILKVFFNRFFSILVSSLFIKRNPNEGNFNLVSKQRQLKIENWISQFKNKTDFSMYRNQTILPAPGSSNFIFQFHKTGKHQGKLKLFQSFPSIFVSSSNPPELSKKTKKERKIESPKVESTNERNFNWTEKSSGKQVEESSHDGGVWSDFSRTIVNLAEDLFCELPLDRHDPHWCV